jgi:hypothetical protein
MSLWYAVRAIPRIDVLACLCLAAVVLTTLHLWTDAAAMLLPLALAATAAASGFAFDDPAVAVTAVTPRARWAHLVRLVAALVPVLLWGAVVLVIPEVVVIDEARWWVVGLAACLLAAGSGVVAAARHRPRPGAAVASALALLIILPLLVGPFLGWDPVFPLGPFPTGVLAVWATVAGFGLTLCAVGLASGPRRRSSSRQ